MSIYQEKERQTQPQNPARFRFTGAPTTILRFLKYKYQLLPDKSLFANTFNNNGKRLTAKGADIYQSPPPPLRLQPSYQTNSHNPACRRPGMAKGKTASVHIYPAGNSPAQLIFHGKGVCRRGGVNLKKVHFFKSEVAHGKGPVYRTNRRFLQKKGIPRRNPEPSHFRQRHTTQLRC